MIKLDKKIITKQQLKDLQQELNSMEYGEIKLKIHQGKIKVIESKKENISSRQFLFVGQK